MNDLLIQNCTFSQNVLAGIPNSIALSSSGLSIVNIVGNVLINQSSFLYLGSNSDINGLSILSENLSISRSTFDTSLSLSSLIQTKNSFNQNINIKGGFMRVKASNLQITQSNFQTSESQIGGFIYAISYSKIFVINITESNFSDSLIQLSGGIIFVDTLGSILEFSISNSLFKNIFQVAPESSLIQLSQDSFGKNAQINNFLRLNNVNFTNIYGEDISSIFSLAFCQLNISQSVYSFDQSINRQQIISLQLNSILYPSTYITSTKSQVYLEGVSIQEVQSLYQKSNNHQVFFSSQNSNFELKDCTVKNIVMSIGGISYFEQGSIDISNLQVNNIQFQPNMKSLRFIQNNSIIQNFVTVFYFTSSIINMSKSNATNIFCQNICEGGLGLIEKSELTIQNSNFSAINSNNGGVFSIINPQIKTTLNQNIFQNNTCNQNGGALQITSNYQLAFNIQILGNIFLNNTAQQGEGGSIYFYSQNSSADDSLIIQNSVIQKNKAYIGGGLKYEGIIPTLINNQISDNTAIFYGQNIFSYPSKLFLENRQEITSNYQGIQVQDNKIIISQQRTGGSIPNMNFTLRNDYGDIMQFGNKEMQQVFLTIQIDPQTPFFSEYYLRGESKAIYNFEGNCFQFKNIDLIGKPQTTVKLIIKSDLIRDSNSQQLTNNYYFEIQAYIQDCQIGQIPYKYNGFQECVICEKGTYSFDQTQCYKCPSGAECQGGSQITVDQGFWRKEQYDSNIIQCEHQQSNCVGGSYGDQICYKGHIGALCEECDIFGEVWGESYAKSSKYSCTLCSKIVGNLYIIATVTIWTLVSMIISIKGYENYQYKQYQSQFLQKIVRKKTYLRGNKKSNLTAKEDQTSVYIKIFTNYFQIISSVATFNLQVPSGIIEFPTSLGQPISQTINSLDCALKKFNSSMPIIYFRLIFSILLPVAYLVIFVVFLAIYQKIIKKEKDFPYYLIYTAYIFLLIYTQPDLVAQMIASLSCRQIGNVKYILSNVSMECYTQDFYKWGFGFILPFLFIFLFLLPYILIVQLKKAKNNLQLLEIKRKYGFLYKEYTQKCYYWEFVKMAQKLAIILQLNFYSQDIKTKGILVFITVTFYSISLMIYKPYKSNQINQLDHYSTNVCAISVLLGLFIYSNDYNYFVIMSLILIILINFLFILMMVRNIILDLSYEQRKNLALQTLGALIDKRYSKNYDNEKQKTLKSEQTLTNKITNLNLNFNIDINIEEHEKKQNEIEIKSSQLQIFEQFLGKKVQQSQRSLIQNEIQSQNEEDYHIEIDEKKSIEKELEQYKTMQIIN
ncbi:transmembrane protein, putative (macronuclear) [Tetrahymena thermophila SB210]|nr:transmembrane protein, putative [Tetrahymena thermophila SB210]EWS71153.1 transmembrane protein, putative [Tetrahymena thermophila SB210]|eukprot:XP_012656294.1 transmembrane protein, putative [Tetrahymena thermophila SB210]